MSFYCVAEEVGAANLLEYCSSLISIHWDELLPLDFTLMTAQCLYKMLKTKTKHPLHSAIRLRREDVVFICLMENDCLVSQHRYSFFYSLIFTLLHFVMRAQKSSITSKNIESDKLFNQLSIITRPLFLTI